MLRYGVNVPNFGMFGDPAVLVAAAERAGRADWDGFFLRDHLDPFREWSAPVADPWGVLGAVAAAPMYWLERIAAGPPDLAP